MVKWLILIAAGYFLFRLFTNDSRHKKQESQREKEEKIATGELVKDPICGTYIDADSGITVRNGDTIHRFCSYECRDAFIKRVRGEIKKVAETAAPEAVKTEAKDAEPAAEEHNA